jgi:hypothetical protein
MEHKAYAFNWTRFEEELSAILYRALQFEGPDDDLLDFIDANYLELSHPDDGRPLSDLWRHDLIQGDAHELGDIALTRYYDPAENHGIDNWMQLSETLPLDAQKALLGKPFGLKGFQFDPGKMGSYFQTPDRAINSLAVLSRYNLAKLKDFQSLLEVSCRVGWGLYVTF